MTIQQQGSLVVREMARVDAQRWDAFVMSCSEATFFHRAGWQRVIEDAFGHRTWFLYAERDGRIEGVLPLAQLNSRLFGNSLISLPFCVYGGVIADSEQVRTMLEEEASALARRLGVDYLEIRNRVQRHSDWPSKDLYVTFRKTIDPDPEKNLLAIPRKQRAVVRKGIEAGLCGEIDMDTSRFFDTYAESLRNLGTPVLQRRYFNLLMEEFGEDCEILTVTKGSQVVSSVMSFYFRDEVLPYYGGGTALARAVRGNDFMYWDLMRRASERGTAVFDYGRSKKGTGSYSFKKNWGFEPEPLHYEFQLIKATDVPDVNPLNPKYQLLINAWKRLPLAVSKVIGPFIAKQLG